MSYYLSREDKSKYLLSQSEEPQTQKTAKTKQKNATLADREIKTTQVGVEKLGNNRLTVEKTKIEGNVVKIKIKDLESGETLIEEIKIHEIAEKLNISTNHVKDLSKTGHLVDILQGILIQPDKQKSSSQKPEKTEVTGARPATSSPSETLINPEVRKKIMAHLDEYGLTKEEFEVIEDFYRANKSDLEELKEPLHVNRYAIDPSFPRSLLYIPDGPRKGLYILAKDHGGVREAGVGSFNRACLALGVDTGEKKIFRTARATHVSDNEIEANRVLAKYPEHFAAGEPVYYKGSWRPRGFQTNRVSNMPKEDRPPRQEENVEKVGFIMDFLEGGELLDRMYADPPLTEKQVLEMAYKICKSIALMHKLGFVNLDIKPENIFLTAEGEPRIGDFGFATHIEEQKIPCGTPGFIAPELIRSTVENRVYRANPGADVWSIGCLLAELAGYDKWRVVAADPEGWHNKNLFERLKKMVFEKSDEGGIIEGSLEDYITQCLSYHLASRPTSKALASGLERAYKQSK